MSSQEQERIESLSVDNTRLRSELQKALASNAALARQASVSADIVVERLEEIDELRITLGASRTREHCLLSEIAELRAHKPVVDANALSLVGVAR